jgi:hypothetical protein
VTLEWTNPYNKKFKGIKLKKIKQNLAVTLLLILAVISSSSANAVINEATLYCNNCSIKEMKALAIRSAGSSDSRYVVLDLVGSVSREILVRQPDRGRGIAASEGYPVSVEVYSAKSELLAINHFLENMKDIDKELAVYVELPIELPSDFAYSSVFQSLESLNTQADFARVMQITLERGQFSEILKNAHNQLELLNSSIGSAFHFVSISLGKWIQNSSWSVEFKDGTQVVVDLSFKMVKDDVEVSIKPDFTKAKDKQGTSIPLAKYSANGYSTYGEQEYINSAVNYFEEQGLVFQKDSAKEKTCKRVSFKCTVNSCNIKYSCSN